MIRLILRLFKITDFEPNETVSILKQQLEYERKKNIELTDTLLNLLKPKVSEAQPQEVYPIVNNMSTFSHRRAALEARDREEARIKKISTNLGKPDQLKESAIDKLEKELGVVSSEGN